MSVFTKFRSPFRSIDTGLVSLSDPFIQIDRKSTIEKFKLDAKAEANGTRNYPDVLTSDLDEVELEIISEFESQAARARNEATSHNKVYGQRLAELSLLRELSSITSSCQTALSDFQRTALEARSRLSLAETAVRESFQELTAFKHENNLIRPAIDGLSALTAWSTFLFAGMIEAILNSLMLKVNDDYGYVGGFMAAAIVAGLNIGVSAFFGRFFFPNLFHKSGLRKILGGISALVWLLIIAVWNLMAAHFRDVKAAGVAQPEVYALQSFLESPFQLDSIYSYGLFLMGTVFAIISAVTALRMKDPYPGYGDLYVRHESRCLEYADAIEDATGNLTDTRDEAIEDATSIRNGLGVQFRERGHVITQREYMRGSYQAHHKHLETMCNSVLDYYRERNKQARADGLVPAHFSRSTKLEFIELPRPQDEPTTENEVIAAQQALSDGVTHISGAYDEAIRGFKYLDQIKQELHRG